MRTNTSLLLLFFASLAVSKSLPLVNSPQHVLNGADLDVPGENHLKFCQSTSDYILTIDYVDLSPNPPVPGKTLLIEAKGHFSVEVTKGAYVNISVKYGLITLIRQTADLCEQMKNVDEECPLDGEKVIRKEIKLPSPIPPGRYTVLADVYTSEGHQITCLEANISF
ncbi:Phosphatidylglycerol/phosphatidylinositol transfer protein [Peltigera leucophlebia]|nr:Phosphatidylglycerol/phosphatidylinositol transfer protein [Peltigera leucophlebia]